MSTIRSAQDDLARALHALESRTSYAEVMAQSTEGHRLRHDKTSTTPEPTARLEGAVFRAWNGARWVEAALSGLGRHALDETAAGLAMHLTGPTPASPPPGAPSTGVGEQSTKERRLVHEFTLEQRLEWARQLFGWATEVDGISNAIVSIESTSDERIFLSTAGARRYQRVGRVRAAVVPLAIENGKVEYDYFGVGGTGGVEVLDKMTEAQVQMTAREARALLAARDPPTGRMAVVLDPGTSGTFAHESFGHGTEADQLLRDRSYLKPVLGQMVGPEELTLVDDGSYPGGWGSIFFDDEGHPSQRTVLVEKGRFVEVLHDRESAAVMGRKATGNTRRADFLSRPFVRMTNTFVEPGSWSLDELVKEAKEGVILQDCTSGMEDPLGGNMQIKVKKAHRIHHGEIAEMLPSLALSGGVLAFLRSIRGIGKKDEFEMSPGYCGKGHTDLLPAGTGGVHLLAEAVVGPA
ncbi:MAG: TldD/PmbA family protein [Thermoplasmata archaeon]|nr:TldD/PmbA family protein [Thermoplasmata archaeon]